MCEGDIRPRQLAFPCFGVCPDGFAANAGMTSTKLTTSTARTAQRRNLLGQRHTRDLVNSLERLLRLSPRMEDARCAIGTRLPKSHPLEMASLVKCSGVRRVPRVSRSLSGGF